MKGRSKTPCGRMLAALARRDEDDFVRWRTRVKAREKDREDLWATTYAVFREAVMGRFPGGDRREIVEFVNQRRVPLYSGASLPPQETEALIRSALGERGLVSGIDRKLVIQIRAQVFVYAIEDLGMTADEVGDLIALAEKHVVDDKKNL